MRVALLGALTLAYPLMIGLGLAQAEPRWLALVLAGLALIRAWGSREPMWLVAAAGALLLSILAAASNQAWPLKLYPVLVNAAMLAAFGLSLVSGP
ncbi:MAG: hypothetical protein RR101_15260, partial [Burkholderiaceae bacterium]